MTVIEGGVVGLESLSGVVWCRFRLCVDSD